MKSHFFNVFTKKAFAFLLIVFCVSINSKIYAQATNTFTQAKGAGSNGNWSTAANWSLGRAPISTDNVVISSDQISLVNGNYTVASVTFASGKSITITVNSGQTLTITGDVNLNRPTSGGNINTLNVGAGNLSCSSIIFQNNNPTNKLAKISISTGTLTVSGDIVFGGTSPENTLEFSGAGTLNIGGTFSSASGDIPGAILTASTGTINYNANTAQTIYPSFSGSYYNLTLSGTATKTLTTGTSFALSSGATLTVSLGTTLDLSGNTITCASGTANVAINGTVTTNNTNGLYGASAAISSTNISNPTFGASSTAIYTSTSIQNVSGLTYNNLTLNGANVKTIAGATTVSGTLTNNSTELSIGSNTLTLNGLYAGSGTITGSSTSNLTIGGAVASTTINMTQTNSTTRSINDLTMSRANGAVLGNAMEVIGTITVSNGTLSSAGNLTLVSNASTTARVASITSGGISGNVIAQRFIPGGSSKRKWRFLSFPVNNGSGGMPISQYIDDIHVTGTGGTTNGFDDCGTCAASLRTYNESLTGNNNIGWTNPATINDVISTGVGYEVFVRGDRTTVQDPFTGTSVPTDVTIDYTGVINSGNYNFNLSYTNTGNTAADGFNLVANPYPSQIDWQAASGWTRTNINIHAYVYNANTGAYGTISTSGATTGDVGISRYIPSGQAFFVKANAASPVIGMTEAIKVSNSPFNFFRNANVAEPSLGFAKFKIKAPNYEDNLVIRLDTAVSDSAIDADDAMKFFNDRLNFYTKSKENINLSINHFPYPDSINVEDTINVSVFSYNDSSIEYRTHRIELAQTVNLDGDIRFDLIDNYTNERISLSTIGWYNFAIDSNTSSYGNNRFDMVVYRIFTGLEQEKLKKLISVFPNPASDQIYFGTASNNQEEVKVSILNLQGQLLSEEFKMMNSENSYSNLINLTEGVYFLKIEGKTFNETHKFIKTK